MQVCGYSLVKWDLVGCCGLNTKKNEEKKLFQFYRGGYPEKKKRVVWVVGLTDNLIFWLVGINRNLNLMGSGGKIQVPSKTPIFFFREQP